MDAKFKSQYDSMIAEWQIKLNQGTDKYKNKFKKYKSYYKQLLVQKGDWEKERASANEGYLLKIKDLEREIAIRGDSIS